MLIMVTMEGQAVEPQIGSHNNSNPIILKSAHSNRSSNIPSNSLNSRPLNIIFRTKHNVKSKFITDHQQQQYNNAQNYNNNGRIRTQEDYQN